MDLRALAAYHKESTKPAPPPPPPQRRPQPVLPFAPEPKRQRTAPVDRLPQAEMPFSCEPCHKGFRTLEALELHQDDHEPCTVRECTFAACSAVMKDHMLLHTPQVQSWINMTEEEVAAWREERRRNWPTAANVERKAAERKTQEKEERIMRHSLAQARDIRFKKPKRGQNLLRDLLGGERRIEMDLLIQCFEHIRSAAIGTE